MVKYSSQSIAAKTLPFCCEFKKTKYKIKCIFSTYLLCGATAALDTRLWVSIHSRPVHFVDGILDLKPLCGECGECGACGRGFSRVRSGGRAVLGLHLVHETISRHHLQAVVDELQYHRSEKQGKALNRERWKNLVFLFVCFSGGREGRAKGSVKDQCVGLVLNCNGEL